MLKDYKNIPTPKVLVPKDEDYTNIRRKLSLNKTAPIEKIKFELNKLKAARNLKEREISNADFKQFGLE